MKVDDLMYLFVESSMQTVIIYDLLKEEVVYKGFGDDIPTELCYCDVMSIDCLPHKTDGRHFDESGYGILTINIEEE